jgi:hypothetical protein
MSDEPQNQTDHVVVDMLALMFGAVIVQDESRQPGLDEALKHMVAHYLTHDLKKAAALTELIRRKSTDNRADPALLNLLRKKPPGSEQPN